MSTLPHCRPAPSRAAAARTAGTAGTAFRAAAACTLAALAFWGTPLAAQTLTATPAPTNVLGLSASASTEVATDWLTLVFGTSREGPDAAAVQAQLRQALDAALAEARKAARPGGQLEVRTGNFSVMPRYAQRGTISGWAGSAELVVAGRDTAAIAQLPGRLQTMTVSRVGWSLSREAREKVEGEVVAQAIAEFRGKADAYARHFGFGGWTVREVQVGGLDQGPPPMPMALRNVASAAEAKDMGLPVEAGRQTVTATVSGTVQMSAR